MTDSKDVLAGIASQLAELANQMRAPADGAATDLRATDRQMGRAELAQRLLHQRQARKQFLSASLFHEPAWELLLCLYVAHDQRTPLNVKHLVSLIDAPTTTSQRWIDQLVHMKLVNRVVDPVDRRRLEISLSEAGASAMGRYLDMLRGEED
jgi:DNA-binding MarR family transcriptional regulator